VWTKRLINSTKTNNTQHGRTLPVGVGAFVLLKRSTTISTSTVRKFTVHPNLLFDVISAQAGTIAKAITEGIANSLDAGSTICNVTLTPTSLKIIDDGKGFGEGEEGLNHIQTFFESFGHPHEDGDARIGRYRLGRGQLFAFTANTWRTGTFQMSVDIKRRGLDYDLKDNLAAVKGCTIEGELYDQLSSHDFMTACREVEQLVAFVDMTVKLNGKTISKDPAKMKWDLVDDNAHYKFKESGPLSLYNLGFLVRDQHASYYGVSGQVVSRKKLDVNFARNDVLVSRCAVFRDIKKQLEASAGRKVERKKALTSDDRDYLAMQILSGCVDDPFEPKVVTDVTGKHHSLSKIFFFPTLPVCVAPTAHDRKGEILHGQGLSFVIARTTLDRFQCDTVDELAAKLQKAWPDQCRWEAKTLDYANATASLNDQNRLLPHKELSWEERLALKTLNDLSRTIFWAIRAGLAQTGIPCEDFKPRDFRAGESMGALAWTDCETYVAIERRHLRTLHNGLDDVFNVLMTVCHEASHDEADTATHDHTLEFYERFHNLAGASAVKWGSLAVRIADRLVRLNAEEGRKSKNALLRATAYASASQKDPEFSEAQLAS